MILGFVGYKGSGKTTIAKEIIKNLAPEGFVACRYSFSRPLEMMIHAMGVEWEVIENKSLWDTPLPVLCNKTMRHATTTLGTEWGRKHIGEDVWVNNLLMRIEEDKKDCLADDKPVFIVDNVRFHNEMKGLSDIGAKFIHITRDINIDLSHESEQHIAALSVGCQYEVKNDELSLSTAVEEIQRIIRKNFE